MKLLPILFCLAAIWMVIVATMTREVGRDILVFTSMAMMVLGFVLALVDMLHRKENVAD